MKVLNERELKAIAERVVRAYKRLPEVQETEFLYVDPAVLARQLLGLTLEFHHLSEDGNVLGLTAFEEVGIEIFDDDIEDELFVLDGKTILVESDMLGEGKSEGRRNFTIVHECSHQILKMLYPREYIGVSARKTIYFRNYWKNRDRDERQVNRLASYILMPDELIMKAMEYTCAGNKIEILNRVWRNSDFIKFESMCYMLGVSKQALANRMQGMGLIGKVQLRNPNELMNIYMEDNFDE